MKLFTGLSIYSDSEESDDADGTARSRMQDQEDSDEELRRTIARKRRDFQNTERMILKKLQADEEAARASQASTSTNPPQHSPKESRELDSHDEKHSQDSDGKLQKVHSIQYFLL